MDDSWQHLLAYAALSAYQHREVGRSNLHGYVDAAVQSFIVAYDVVSLFDLLYGFFVHDRVGVGRVVRLAWKKC